MNTKFPGFLVGTTLTADDTTDYVVNSTVTFATDINSDANSGMVDGQYYTYYVRYPDNTTAGHEEGWGRYTLSTDTIQREVIGKSSAGYGVPVDWDDGGATKHIAIVVSGSEIGNMARIAIDLPPWVDYRVGVTGQSNVAQGNLAVKQDGAFYAANPMVQQWATDGSGSANGWRTLDPEEQDGDVTVGSAVPYTGTGRRVEIDSVWYYTGSIAAGYANRMQAVLGRGIRLINTATLGQAIDSGTYGWTYGVSGNTAMEFASEVGDAIAALPAEQRLGTPDVLHAVIWAQGETDISTSSPAYAWKLATVVFDFEDPARHGICDETITKYLFCGFGDRYGQTNPAFHGLQLAKQIVGDRATFIKPQRNIAIFDTVHYVGEDSYAYGELLADYHLGIANTPSQDPAFEIQEIRTDMDALTKYTVQTEGESVLTAGQIQLAADHLSVRIAKSDNQGGFGQNWWDKGLKYYGNGDYVTIEVTEDIVVTNGQRIDFTGPPVESTNYAEWPCTVTDFGTVPVATNQVIMNCSRFLFDGESFRTGTDLELALPSISEGYEVGNSLAASEYKLLSADGEGILRRTAVSSPFRWELKTTNATANQSMGYSFAIPNPGYARIEAKVSYKIVGGNCGAFTLIAMANRSGVSTLTLPHNPAATVEYDPESLTVPNIALFTFGFAGIQIRVTGKAATDVHWVAEGTITLLPTLA